MRPWRLAWPGASAKLVEDGRSWLVFQALGAAVGLVRMAGGQDGSGSSAVSELGADGVTADSEADGFLSSDVQFWLNVAELALFSAIIFVGTFGVLWHFTTFNNWIDSTLVYAEEAAVAGLGAAGGAVSGTIQTARDGVDVLTDTAATAAEIASPGNIVGTLSRGGSSLAGSDGSSERSPRSRSQRSRSPRSRSPSPTLEADDLDLNDDAVDMSDSFKHSPRSISAKVARQFAGQQGARRVNEANQLATNTVTTTIKVPAYRSVTCLLVGSLSGAARN